MSDTEKEVVVQEEPVFDWTEWASSEPLTDDEVAALPKEIQAAIKTQRE